MWKSEIFLKKIYRASIQHLIDAAEFLNDTTEEQAHPPSLDLIKENIGVYLQAFYDNKLLINNAYDTNMHTSVKGEFVKSLVHDNIDTNNLVGSLGVFKYEKNPSINENAEMEPIQGGEGPSTPPHPSSYKSIDTPAKEILKFLKEKDDEYAVSVLGYIDNAFVLINSNFKDIYILIYYTFFIDDVKRNNHDTIQKISKATGIPYARLMEETDVERYNSVEYDNILYEDLEYLVNE